MLVFFLLNYLLSLQWFTCKLNKVNHLVGKLYDTCTNLYDTCTNLYDTCTNLYDTCTNLYDTCTNLSNLAEVTALNGDYY